DRGPRIDYKIIKDEQQNLKLDYPKILRSVMSFLLAGVDEATLSYGILDSMGEFFGNFIQDLCVNFSLQNVLIFGSLLEEKIFLDKILHYIPKNIHLVLPKKDYLDYYN
ncbi:protein hydE, partial [Campylobacter lari]